MRFAISLDLSGLHEMGRDLATAIPKAASRALNRTADTTATAAAREISAATKIKVREVRDRIKVRGANPTRLVAEVIAYPYAPNLKQFRATQNKTGVAASAWESRKTYRHAFIDPRTGRVVTRTTNKRFPLKGLRGPSVRSTFMQDQIQSKLEAVARQTWAKRIDYELARALRK